MNMIDNNILIIVPTTSLVEQLYKDFKDYGFDVDKNVSRKYHGYDIDLDKRITISTWQSLYKMPKKFFEDYGAVIGDEAHLFKAVSLTKIMTKLTDCKYRIGLTGTLDDSKTHKLVLQGLFGMVNKVVSTSELIDRKQLAQLKVICLNLKYNEVESKKVKDVKYFEELEYITSSKPRNKYIRNLALALKGNTLLLFQLVEKHGEILFNLIKEKAEKDWKVFFVFGGTDTDDREQIRAITEREDNAIIVASYGTFSTGINIRNLHNIVFSSPTKSPIRVLQSIGRGLRVGDKKDSATVYDISDNLAYKGKDNFTLNHFKERVNIYNNLKRLIDVYDVVDATKENCHVREHALMKISLKPDEIHEIEKLVSEGNCKILDQDPKCMILEISGDESTVEENINILSKFKVLELLRSGKMAMISGDQDRNKPVLTRSEP